MRAITALMMMVASASTALAAVVSSTQHGPLGNSLDAQIAVGDAISGLLATELAGDKGWHPANPAATNGSSHPSGLPTFTDDAGGSGLMGLLNDFPGAGAPTKRIQYTLSGPTTIGAIQVLSGNDGRDGRVFSTFTIQTSTDNGSTFSPLGLGYFQSDPSGTVNAGQQWGSTLVSVTDDASPVLAAGVTDLIFEFFAVDNTGGQMRDPYDGVNPFTGVDDGLSAAFVSPLIWEIDVIAIPEPAAGALLACGVVSALANRPRRR